LQKSFINKYHFLEPSNRNNLEIRTGFTQAIKVRKVGLNWDHIYLMPQPYLFKDFRWIWL